MAAGPGAASSGHGGSRSGSSAALESSLDRRFQGVTNTMESIQGLSAWCIENKKYHNLIVRYWMKWLKKSDANHRLNLFYLANDVIQNCKRKNAIVYRTTFASVLPDAALLVKDGKVRKSVERIFSIWQERNVYPEELISELKSSLQKKEAPPPPDAVNPKTALKSKIVAEFAPQVLIDQLSGHKRALEEADLREKQLASLRLDICSTEALKRLKDKAGGKKFSKDFEEGSTRLQEFVTFLEGQMKAGPPLLEALGNADVFYEMQYKEVKIVANAYKTFANRVSNLKRKLDALKTTLPNADDSPIPSPSEDAPSPTGSESPFHGMGGSRGAHAEHRGSGERDNRNVEDMDLSEEEEENTGTNIIVEEAKEKPTPASVSKFPGAAATKTAPATDSKPAAPTRSLSEPAANQVAPSNTTPSPSTPGPAPLQVNLANVDLGKISSILSSLTNVMKSTGESPVSRPSPGTPTTPSNHTPSTKPNTPAPGSGPAPNPLASILSRVEISPESILSALTKTQAHSAGLQGLSSLLHSVAGNSGGAQTSAAAEPSSPSSSSTSSSTNQNAKSAAAMATTPTTPTTPKTPKASAGSTSKRESERERGREWERVREREREREKEREREREKEREREAAAAAAAMPSLESKINSFLQGNPGFSALGLGMDDIGGDSPLLVGGDNVDGTPVRDESGGTPTQDEIMDKPGACDPSGPSRGHNLSPTAYRNDPWDAVITPRETNDRDYRTPSSSSAYPAFGATPSKKPAKPASKTAEEDAMKRHAMASAGGSSSSSALDQSVMKVKTEGLGGRVGDVHLKNAVSRKISGGSDEGSVGREREEKGKKSMMGKEVSGSSPPGGEAEGQHYHRIETVVSSSCGEGAPIQTVGYNNRRMSGERIQTVESIRVIGRGSRRGSLPAARVGGAWYEEEEFMEVPPGATPETSDDLGLVPPASHLMPGHARPQPHPLPPPAQYPPSYTTENSHTHSVPQQHPPPPSSFFPSSLPPIPQPPPPPIPQPPPPPREILSPTTSVMVGGVLVPIDRVLPYPPSNTRSEGGDRVPGGTAAPNAPGFKDAPPRPGTVKEHFAPRHAPPLHRPGAPGVPPPLLGRARDGPSPPPPASTSSAATSSAPPSPSAEALPLLPSPSRLPTGVQSQRPPAGASVRPPAPQSLLRLPTTRPALRSPLPQRPFLRSPVRHPTLNREPLLPGAKRPGPAFTPGQAGSFHPPKRPYLPPRY
ncbi:regulation of nuclear pre-mRNA domain-containing protein 2 [Chanos chanos]|uniref:Regulation of nuclear pre-mRNA domain-containing protein 2 n=1 Tax=Chanos chanos TaxID=29144 RepID=A0A6J2W7J7_CHACN|nr:regulation of nuclear pre-mRNA domain-containing protein 2-like [Chanos chanos]